MWTYRRRRPQILRPQSHKRTIPESRAGSSAWYLHRDSEAASDGRPRVARTAREVYMPLGGRRELKEREGKGKEEEEEWRGGRSKNQPRTVNYGIWGTQAVRHNRHRTDVPRVGAGWRPEAVQSSMVPVGEAMPGPTSLANSLCRLGELCCSLLEDSSALPVT